MFIIFEGCDGTGKTGLASAVYAEILSRDPDCSVLEIHRSQLTRPPLEEYVHDVAYYVPGGNHHIVADRWHYGEEVYGPIYRGKSASTLAQFRWIELWLSGHGANVWHVKQPLDRLVERLTTRGEDYLRPEHVELVSSMFADVAKEAITHTGDVEPEGDTTDLVKRIVDRAEYSDNLARPLNAFPSYVGSPLPHTLLVGDTANIDSAFIPGDSDSADFLLSSLPDEWWRGVGLVNADETLPGLVDTLFGPTVIALGRDASDKLLDLDVEHAGVPHPRHIKQFHPGQKMHYGFLIRENGRTGEMTYTWPK